jgi:hypothetical protein
VYSFSGAKFCLLFLGESSGGGDGESEKNNHVHMQSKQTMHAVQCGMKN